MTVKESVRTVNFGSAEIQYVLERKKVKNINLRIKRDGTVKVSAASFVPAKRIDEFVLSKGEFILSALKKFSQRAEFSEDSIKYEDGDSFYIMGKCLYLKVLPGKPGVEADGGYIYLTLPDTDDTAKKKRLMEKFRDEECMLNFGEILDEIYPVFSKMGVEKPQLKIRKMESRWGSCAYGKGVITLNKRLMAAPRECIEYVIVHEMCHFIHPDHSSRFHNLVASIMPDWKERKNILEKMPQCWY